MTSLRDRFFAKTRRETQLRPGMETPCLAPLRVREGYEATSPLPLRH